MGVYHVNHRHSATHGSSATTYVVLEEGADVELDDDLAEWVNRDSPGCLTALGVQPAEEPPAAEPDDEQPAEESVPGPPAAPRRGGARRG
jgi:hypothetical protein